MYGLLSGQGVKEDVVVLVVMMDVVFFVLGHGVVAIALVEVVDVEVVESAGTPLVIPDTETVVVAPFDTPVVPGFVDVVVVVILLELELGQGVADVVDVVVVEVPVEGELLTPAEVVPLTPVLVVPLVVPADETPVVPETPVPVVPLTPTVPTRPVPAETVPETLLLQSAVRASLIRLAIRPKVWPRRLRTGRSD